MTKRPVITVIALLLLVSAVVPAAFFLAPRRASADVLACAGGVAAGIAAATTWATTVAVPSGDVPSGSASWSTYGTTLGECLYTYVLVPMARAYMRELLQRLSGDIISWVSGTSAPGGQRSFVPNISLHLQAVGDSVAGAFIKQLTAGFGSPFDLSIASSLRLQYLRQSSVAGFFSQFRSTLGLASPNVNSFLAGNWSQGGVGAWLTLTTQPQNNPYLLYQAAAAQLSNNLASAQTNRRQDLIQGGGFLSFCPPGSNAGGSTANPTAQCTTPDGSAVSATTPGSVIQSYLTANLNSGVGQLVSAQDIDGFLQYTLQGIIQGLANRILNRNGLFSVNAGNRPGIPTLPTGTPPGSPTEVASSTLANIAAYRTAWNTINASAHTAEAALNVLTTSCTAELSAGKIGTLSISQNDVQTALGSVTAAEQNAQSAFAAASSTEALARQVLSEISSGSSQLTTDLIALSVAPPSTADVSTAQQNAQSTGGAHANPSGSLVISGGTTQDQMTLMTTNATNLASQCAGYTGPPGGNPTGTTPLDGGNLPNRYGSTLNSLLEKYATPNANQPLCFNAVLNPQDVGTNRMFFLQAVQNPGGPITYTGGNITYWLSSSFNGQPMTSGCSNGGTQTVSCTQTASFTYTRILYFSAPAAGTYYWCMKLDTAGNTVGAELWPGPQPAGT